MSLISHTSVSSSISSDSMSSKGSGVEPGLGCEVLSVENLNPVKCQIKMIVGHVSLLASKIEAYLLY